MSKNISSSLAYKEKLQKLQNESEFFEFDRLEQKTRIKDEMPSAAILIKLELSRDLINEIYGIQKTIETQETIISEGNEEIRSVKKEIKVVPIADRIYDTIRKSKMELPISINGKGREEFTKLYAHDTKEEKKEEEKDLMGKIFDAVG